MARGVLHVWPPLVVLENTVGPLKAAVCRSASGLPLGVSSRSHTAYASPGVVGSAVTDSLSLKNWKLGALSVMIWNTLPQVLPPSVEVAATTALLLLELLNEIAMA